MTGVARFLLLADTHLGFDLPTRPRVERRRRGHDFLANYERALAPAFAGEVGAVIHAGDVFDRSSVVATLAFQAFEPLRRIADMGIPVFVVPGNHERSRLPHLRFARHPNLHVFTEPRTVVISVEGLRVALSGFPYERHDVRHRFPQLVAQTHWSDAPADVRLLCVHHCVEGASVGPADYTFTTAADVIRTADIPGEFTALLSGHIHRHQVLTRDLRHRPLSVPVIYPGSVERTALAEIGETKGYMMLGVAAGGDRPRLEWEFRELPARPMIREELDASAMTASAFSRAVESVVSASPRDAVISIRVAGALTPEHWRLVSARRLRELAPEMNIEIVGEERMAPMRRGRSDGSVANVEPATQLTLL